MVFCLPYSWSNWNLEMLVFEERGKPEYPEKNLSEQRSEPTTNSTHVWRRRRDLNPGQTDGRRALPPLRHPLLPMRTLHLLHIYPRENLRNFEVPLNIFYRRMSWYLPTRHWRRPSSAQHDDVLSSQKLTASWRTLPCNRKQDGICC